MQSTSHIKAHYYSGARTYYHAEHSPAAAESSYTSNPRSNSAIQINHQPNSQANSSTYKAQDLAGSTLNAVALNPNLQQ